jgi:hypothetical protein
MALSDDVKAALAKRFAEVFGQASLDSKGYMLEANGKLPTAAADIFKLAATRFPTTVPPQVAMLALQQLAGGAGGELKWNNARPPNFLAAHSSSALAAATFAPFLTKPNDLTLAGASASRRSALKPSCPSPAPVPRTSTPMPRAQLRPSPSNGS